MAARQKVLIYETMEGNILPSDDQDKLLSPLDFVETKPGETKSIKLLLRNVLPWMIELNPYSFDERLKITPNKNQVDAGKEAIVEFNFTQPADSLEPLDNAKWGFKIRVG